MKRNLQATVLCLMILSLIACTSKPSPPVDKEAPPQRAEESQPGAKEAPPQRAEAGQPGSHGRDLFPKTDSRLYYDLTDQNLGSDEMALVEGDRLVQTFDGKPYVTWHFRPEGVYRAAPGNSGPAAFLRYLPDRLEDGLAWKQSVGTDVYLFELTKPGSCPVRAAGKAVCWQVKVLSTSESMTFTFAEGLGVVRAESITPAHSYVKELRTPHGSVKVDQAERQGHFQGATTWNAQAAAKIEPITRNQFAEAAAAKQATQVIDVFYWNGKFTPFPSTPNGCNPRSGTVLPHLDVRILEADWRPHPDAKQSGLVVPTVTFTACNQGAPLNEPDWLKFPMTPEFVGDIGGFILDKMKAGEKIGPIRLYGNGGVPKRIFDLWQEDAKYWPLVQLSANVSGSKVPLATGNVERILGGTAIARKAAQTPPTQLPVLPTVDLLQRLAWSKAEFEGVTAYLYAPDARYHVTASDYCGATVGSIGAEAKQWGIFLSKAGGAPVKAMDLGDKEFEAGRGLTAETISALDTTFLYVNTYGSCASPNQAEVLAYDQKTGDLYQPQMQRENGTTGGLYGSGVVYKGGTFVDSYFANEDSKYHTVVYRLNPATHTFVFVSHSTK